MKGIFIGSDGKLRGGWRALVFFVAFFFVAVIFVLGVTATIAQFDLGERSIALLPIALPFAVSALIAIALGVVFARLFEGLDASSLGLNLNLRALGTLSLGCLIGGVAIGSAVLIAAMGGGLSLALNRGSAEGAIFQTLWTTFVVLGIGALSEETLFRGYMLQTLVRSKAVAPGVVITSLLFAFVHNGNPGVSYFALFNTALAGLWFALAYLRTRDIWFPLGIHFMWNWLQGPVLGINVSGLSTLAPDPVFRATDAGPAILTGGSYGIEGGFACTIAIAISIGVIYFLPIKPAGS